MLISVILCRYYHTPGLTCTSRPCRFVHQLDGLLSPSSLVDMKSPVTGDATQGTFAQAQMKAQAKALKIDELVENGAAPGETVVLASDDGAEIMGTVFLMSGGGKGPAGKSRAKYKSESGGLITWTMTDISGALQGLCRRALSVRRVLLVHSVSLILSIRHDVMLTTVTRSQSDPKGRLLPSPNRRRRLRPGLGTKEPLRLSPKVPPLPGARGILRPRSTSTRPTSGASLTLGLLMRAPSISRQARTCSPLSLLARMVT